MSHAAAADEWKEALAPELSYAVEHLWRKRPRNMLVHEKAVLHSLKQRKGELQRRAVVAAAAAEEEKLAALYEPWAAVVRDLLAAEARPPVVHWLWADETKQAQSGRNLDVFADRLCADPARWVIMAV